MTVPVPPTDIDALMTDTNRESCPLGDTCPFCETVEAADAKAVKAEMQATIEQALYEAEADGLLRSAGRIDIAKRIVFALTVPSSCACGFPDRHTNLPCSR